MVVTFCSNPALTFLVALYYTFAQKRFTGRFDCNSINCDLLLVNLFRSDDPCFVLEEPPSRISTDCNKTKPTKLVRKIKPHISSWLSFLGGFSRNSQISSAAC